VDWRIGHILLDEFQDTSQPQYELLQALTRGWSPGDGRTLFLVGDPMQSIYGFRQAEVRLFLASRDQRLSGRGAGIHPAVCQLPLSASAGGVGQPDLSAGFPGAR
jgi:ATP-dependent exoDNAse (exonuclease V) beta subunit